MTHLPKNVAARLQQVLVMEREHLLGQIAVRRGLITEGQLREALQEQAAGDPKKPLGAILVAHRWIESADLVSLVEEQRRLEFARVALEKSPNMPAEARAWLIDPARNLAEFVLVAQLGRGGAGQVWKAWDRQLHRWVAVKTPTLPPDSREGWDRFNREVQAAARLSHPNIVPIYRVAEQDGRPYIVMRLIEGRTLAELRLPIRTAAEVMRAAALAVHYAHTHGVVHRDLKPGNIMRDDQGVVHVLDFGLAHLVEANRTATATGIVGTPAYMSPEQARGEPNAREPAVDVYGLGATLYELATGREPFHGESLAEVIRRVTDEDPAAPRRLNPQIPKELETIILKAMDKDPRRRYPTANDFAEDLRRYLNDEPILARPASWTHRLYRRVRKNPVAYVFGALAIVAAAVATAVWLAGREPARRLKLEQEALESERRTVVEMMRQKARTCLSAALELRRAGANDRMRQFLPVLEEEYRRAQQRAPGLAEVEYLMGRMHRALMNDEQALWFQERAIRADPGYAPALYERAVLKAKKYGREFEQARRTLRTLRQSPEPGGPWKDPSTEDVERAFPKLAQLRTEILADCERAPAARGILEFYRENFQKARELLEGTLRADPTIEEAWEALAKTLEALGEDRRADDCYSEAISRDRGYLPFYLGRGELRYTTAHRRSGRGEDPLPDFAAAEGDFTQALRLDGSNVAALLGRAMVRIDRGVHLDQFGKDALADYAEAEKDLSQVLELEPRNAGALLYRGRLHLNRGSFRSARGESPRPDCDAAEADFTRAIELDRTSAEAWMSRGVARSNRAAWLESRGQDPLPDYEAAEKDIGEALRLSPTYVEAWVRRGRVRSNRAGFRAARGEDPLPDYEGAEKDLNEAIRLNPRFSMALVRRASVRNDRALHLKETGKDPMKDFEDARKDLEDALNINPKNFDARMLLGKVHVNRASYLNDTDKDPMPDSAAAVEHFTRALELNAGDAQAWMSRGLAFSNLGNYKMRRRQDPVSDLDAADRDLSRALRLDKSDAKIWMRRGLVRCNRATWRKMRNEDPMPDWSAAEVDYTEALRIKEDFAVAWYRRGMLRNDRGVHRWELGQEPSDDWRTAEVDLTRAVEINRRYAEAWYGRGKLHWNRAQYHEKADRVVEAKADYRAAAADWTEATRINPALKRALGDLLRKARDRSGEF